MVGIGDNAIAFLLRIYVHVPSLPVCISEGETMEETLENTQEAIELYLEPLEDELITQQGEARIDLKRF
ncbi:type II toxin-antitoxin system HicB family antitoxin [uncultured Nostoc sp.]|uniref:type II toxin-antitoxin system HicB family antitoxin n=1 Tax=uncultured Nostoc sp. TaxID=340711 RepID=UPI0035CB2FD3